MYLNVSFKQFLINSFTLIICSSYVYCEVLPREDVAATDPTHVIKIYNRNN